MKRWLSWVRRRWLLLSLSLAFAVVVILQFGNLERLGLALAHGRSQWLFLAGLLQLAFYLLYAAQYHLGFAIMDVGSRWQELVPVVFASVFLQAVVPSGGVSSLAVFVDDASRRGQSPMRTAEGALLVLVADLITMLPVILYGVLYLFMLGVLPGYEMIVAAAGVAIYLLFGAALVFALLLGRWRPQELRRALHWLQENLNWLAGLAGRPALLAGDWADKQAADEIAAARGLADRPRRLRGMLGIACAMQLINLSSLYVVSLAYRWPLGLGALAAAFSMNVVFSVVNVIPHGLGTAEAIMAVVLAALGVAAPVAAAIAVAFRGLNIWLPLAVGFFFLRRVRSFGGEWSG